MEVAASLVTSAASVTVIGKDLVPFFASLGEQVSFLIFPSFSLDFVIHACMIFNETLLCILYLKVIWIHPASKVLVTKLVLSDN